MPSDNYWACYTNHRMPNGDVGTKDYFPVCIQCKGWQEEENAAAAPEVPWPAYLRTRPGEETGYGFVPWTWKCKTKIDGKACGFRVAWESTHCHNPKCAPPDGGPRPSKPQLVWGPQPTLVPYDGPTLEEIEEAEELRGQETKKGHRWVPGCPAVCKSPHDFEFSLRVLGPRRVHQGETISVTAVILPQIDPAKPIGQLHWEITEGQDIATFPKSKGTTLVTHGAETEVTVRTSEPGKVLVQCRFRLGKNALGEVEEYPVKVKKNLEREVLPAPKVELEFYEPVAADVKIQQVYLEGPQGKSNSYTTAGDQETKEELGADDFHFAPAADPEVTLSFTVDDPEGVAPKLRLELYTGDGGTLLGTRDLPEDALGGGRRSYAWDGLVQGEGSHLPLGYPTLEHSPYKLRLVFPDVEGEPDAHTYFQVKAAAIELAFGDRDMIPAGAHEGSRRVVKHLEGLAKLPDSGRNPQELLPIVLPMSTLCTKVGKHQEMIGINNVTTENRMQVRPDEAHEGDWGDGPSIPVLARVLVETNDGEAVFSPRAVGQVLVCWQVGFPTTAHLQDLRERNPGEEDEFVQKVRAAEGYEPDGVGPDGEAYVRWNAKRSSSYFSTQGGDGAFPFEATATNGDSAAWGWTRRDGDHAGYAGAVVRPSRFGGDAFTLTVGCCLDEEGAPDDVPLALQDATVRRTTGLLQTWRSLPISTYHRGRQGLSAPWGQAEAMWSRAYVKLGGPGGARPFKGKDWNAVIGDLAAGDDAEAPTLQEALFTKLPADADVPAMFVFRTCEEYNALIRKAYAGNSEKLKELLFVDAGGEPTPEDYRTQVEAREANGWLYTLYEGWLRKAGSGIHALHFPDFDSLKVVGLSGKAPKQGYKTSVSDALGKKSQWYGVPGTTAQRALLLLFGSEARLGSTVAHELGHHLGLTHGQEGSPTPSDPHPNEHTTGTCLMSYAEGARALCGHCMLLAGGWSLAKLQSNR